MFMRAGLPGEYPSQEYSPFRGNSNCKRGAKERQLADFANPPWSQWGKNRNRRA
jgi:hypothetical protein